MCATGKFVRFLFMLVVQTHKHGNHSCTRPCYGFDVTVTSTFLLSSFSVMVPSFPTHTEEIMNKHV